MIVRGVQNLKRKSLNSIWPVWKLFLQVWHLRVTSSPRSLTVHRQAGGGHSLACSCTNTSVFCFHTQTVTSGRVDLWKHVLFSQQRFEMSSSWRTEWKKEHKSGPTLSKWGGGGGVGMCDGLYGGDESWELVTVSLIQTSSMTDKPTSHKHHSRSGVGFSEDPLHLRRECGHHGGGRIRSEVIKPPLLYDDYVGKMQPCFPGTYLSTGQNFSCFLVHVRTGHLHHAVLVLSFFVGVWTGVS